MNTIEIKLSKLKLVLMFLGSLLFIAGGILFIRNPTEYESFIMRSPIIIFIAGCVGVLFFGITGFFIFTKIIDNHPGLIISNEGITENVMYVSAGFIRWDDVIKIEKKKIVNQTFISIIVRNPNEYIEKQKSAFSRKIMRENYKKFGTPIGISVNGLKSNYDNVKKILEKGFADFKNRK
jgi:hypothetical protein